MCTVGFQGKGYSSEFTENYASLKEYLDKNPDTQIAVQSRTDNVCAPCPHNWGEGRCAKELRVQGLDQRHSNVLGLKDGDILSWAEGVQRIKDNMNLEEFRKACEGCEWKALGICEDALRELIGD